MIVFQKRINFRCCPRKPLFYLDFCFEMKLFRIGYINYASIPIAFVMLQRSGIFTFTLVGYFFLSKTKKLGPYNLFPTAFKGHCVSLRKNPQISFFPFFFFFFFYLLIVRLQKFKYA